MAERKLVQDLFIRVCRDSRFTLDATRAADLVGKMLNSSALVVWLAMPCLDVMNEIAAGSHPAAHK